MAFAAIRGLGRVFSRGGAARAAGKGGGISSRLKGLCTSAQNGLSRLFGKGKKAGSVTGNSIKPETHLRAEMNKPLLKQGSLRSDDPSHLASLDNTPVVSAANPKAANSKAANSKAAKPEAATPPSTASAQTANPNGNPFAEPHTPSSSAPKPDVAQYKSKLSAEEQKVKLSAEDRALLEKVDDKQDLARLGAKDDIAVGTKKATAPTGAVEPEKGGFWSNGLVQTIGGTVAGTLGVSALTSMFSGGGASAEAAADPTATASTAASSYDPYASSGSYGIPGSIPSYI